MKTQLIILTSFILAMLSQCNYASEPSLGSNPFLSDSVKKKQNVHIFSFSDESHRVPDIFKAGGSGSDNSGANNYLERALQTKVDGFALVDSADIPNIDELISGFQNYDAFFELTIKPQILKQQSRAEQLYRSAQFVGDISHLRQVIDKEELSIINKHLGGNFIAGKGWDQLTYIVSNLLFGKMILEVYCFSDGAGTVMDLDAINYYVNTHPGILYVLQDNEGNAHTQLSWLSEQCSFSIQLAKNINSDDVLKKAFKKFVQAI